MGDAKANTTSPSVHERGNEHPKAFSLDLPSLFLQIPQRLQNCVKSQLKKLAHEGSEAKSVLSTESKSLTAVKSNLDKQLKAWKENPVWVEQSPEIKVNVPKGSLCNLNVKVKVGLPPDAIFDIVTDPDNRRVFKNIKEVTSRRVLLDEGSRQVVEVEQAALWRFLWWSGTISVHVMVDQNRDDYSMKFKQVKAGFMKQFEGCWTLQPLFVDEKICFPFKPRTWDEYDRCTRGKGRVGSIVNLEQLIQPALVPPPPISWYLRGITTRTTEMLINDLVAEAARIRGDFTTAKYGLEAESSQNTGDEDLLDTVDIKKRWIQRRRGTGRHKEHRRR